jgi:hypothetical protein
LVIEFLLKLLDCDWIRIGLSIHFEKWIWIWIDNHIFLMDLDWIDNPKKSDWATAWVSLYSARRLIGSRIKESAAYCNQKLLAYLYLDSVQNTSANWIIRLLLLPLCWPKVIILSGGNCNRVSDSITITTTTTNRPYQGLIISTKGNVPHSD